jgi:hypothetical protein
LKHILIIAWEFPGKNSISGQALSRRISQLYKGFVKNGFKVTFIHPDHIGELEKEPFSVIEESDLLTRVCTQIPPRLIRNSIVRKLNTIIEVAKIGDYTGIWAHEIANKVYSGAISIARPDVILSFYTPRGPLLLGSLLKDHFEAKLIFDFQDPYYEGIGNKGLLYWLNRIWTKKILKNANFAVFINQEWANETLALRNIAYKVINHAIPQYEYVAQDQHTDNCVYFSGRLELDNQDIKPFLRAFDRFCELNKGFFLKLSVTKEVEKMFRTQIEALSLQHISIVATGWLSQTDLHQQIVKSKIIWVVPWCNPDRIGIPSKFYEYMAFDKPILIAGPDSGGFKTFFNDHECVESIFETPETILHALNHTNKIFKKEMCAIKPINEADLVEEYIKLTNA